MVAHPILMAILKQIKRIAQVGNGSAPTTAGGSCLLQGTRASVTGGLLFWDSRCKPPKGWAFFFLAHNLIGRKIDVDSSSEKSKTPLEQKKSTARAISSAMVSWTLGSALSPLPTPRLPPETSPSLSSRPPTRSPPSSAARAESPPPAPPPSMVGVGRWPSGNPGLG